MILQELVRFYDRKFQEGKIAPEGFETKEIPYLIEIDKDGKFIKFLSTWEDSKKKKARSFLVPQAVKKTNGVDSNLLWDNLSYIIGYPDPKKLEDNISKNKEKEYRDRLQEQRKAFYERINSLPKIEEVNSILTFLTQEENLNTMSQDSLWEEISNSSYAISFKLVSEIKCITENLNIIRSINQQENEDSGEKQVCLITGIESVISRLHPSIKGVRDAQPVGSNIVSFDKDSFKSYGKENGYNAPVSSESTFCYTTALNFLLSKDSRQKIQIGDATTIYWSEKPSELEGIFSSFFEDSKETKEDNETLANEGIRDHFTSPFTGKEKLFEEKNKFFILGLSPNSSRISIRFWYPTTIGEISKNIEQHFRDLYLEFSGNESGFISIIRILRSTALQGKLDNVNPILAGKLATAIMSGSEYPRLLLSSLLIRVKAERKINFERCSVLKAILNRKGRKENFITYPEVKEKMDDTNTNIAYRLGRLFAVMEIMQERAIGGGTTIKDSYYTSASTRPATVFAKLFALSNHHASKLGNKSVYFEKLKGDILQPLAGSIPRTFSLEEQGLFAIGYYQQRTDLFKSKKEEGEE
jgi:CRISPR-associated protein Csd1